MAPTYQTTMFDLAIEINRRKLNGSKADDHQE